MTRRIVIPGLAPSSSLAPSASLAPATTVYGGGPITPHQIAMALGTAGAYLDISGYVEFGEGISRTYGRQTDFDTTGPGTFTFTLNNSDGRFTPDNPTSPYPTKVMEGMGVSWLLGTRIVHGSVLTMEIPTDETSWHQIVITCDDMLGAAGRHSLTTLADELVTHQGGDLLWRLDDEPDENDTELGAEANQDPIGPFTARAYASNSTTDIVTMGVQQADGLPGTAVTITSAPGETNWFGTRYGNTLPISNSTNKAATAGQNLYTGAWNLWVYPGSTVTLIVFPKFGTGPGYTYPFQMAVTPTTVAIVGGTGTVATFTLPAFQQIGGPHYYSLSTTLVWQTASSTWALFLYCYIDGIYLGSTPWLDPVHGYAVPGTAGSMTPLSVGVAVPNPSGSGTNVTGTVQRVSHTTGGAGLEQNALYNILNERRAVLDFIADDISSSPYNGPLTTATIGYPDITGSSILDVYNDIMRTENGHLFTLTTGTLLNPVEQIQIRARDRPATVKAAFHVTDEGDGVPTFIRDITNLAAQVEVSGPTNTVTVADTTIKGPYVTGGQSETVLYIADEDLREWGQDRIARGKNRSVRLQTFTINALTTPTDRTADLLGLVPGDRISITGTPAAVLGFTSWDGWLLGATEQHTIEGNTFTFTLAQTLPTTAIYDTDRFASDGDITLNAAISSSATSLTVTSTSGATLSTDVPYTVLIDSEQVTVTAVSGTTATVTRAAGGSTAAAHANMAPVEIVPVPLFAY